jgi:hypothetical protein
MHEIFTILFINDMIPTPNVDDYYLTCQGENIICSLDTPIYNIKKRTRSNVIMINPRLRGGGKKKLASSSYGREYGGRECVAEYEKRMRIRTKKLKKGKWKWDNKTQDTPFNFYIGPRKCCNLIIVKPDGTDLGARFLCADESMPIDVRYAVELVSEYWFWAGYKVKSWITRFRYGIEQEHYDGLELRDDGIMYITVKLMEKEDSSADILLNRPIPNLERYGKGIYFELIYMAAKDNIEGKSWYRRYKTDAWYDEGTITFTSTLVRRMGIKK